ncbi:MAG: hypothetical protein KBI32_01740 [Phycisphaerae bacterium]|mgnify:FL=1|nr:hypothetical protein [Phycisphaerae bacterium]HON91967.1 hypothetical protein [Sedimentisphaerales bacterium]
MTSSTVIRKAKRKGLHGSILVVSVLVLAGASQALGGYTYQTRSTVQSPNAARQRHVASLLGDGRVGLFAGFGRTDVELFDPATETFVTSRATRWFGDVVGVTLPDGNVLLVDGEHDCIFDYLTEQYIPAVNGYPGGFIRFPVLVPLPDGKVFICAGSDIDTNPVAACGLFDPRTRRFGGLGDLASPRVAHSAVLVNEYQALICGGYNYANRSSEPVTLDSLELFDTNAGRSGRIRTSLLHPRYSHCSVLLPDGRVLILGGTFYPSDVWMRSTEVFDPHTSTISEGPALGLGRSGALTAPLPSGRIAIFGGNYDSRAVEIYCPESGTFELAPMLMAAPRWRDFTATSLESGAVLLVGGRVNGSDETLRSAEVFEEVQTQAASAPAMTLDSIRSLLNDRDPWVVTQTVEWLVGLGPQVKTILETLTLESSDAARQAQNALDRINVRNYPAAWCVEVWDASGRLDTVWLDNFDCPSQHNAANPDPHVRSIQRVTEGLAFTHVVVRFPTYASYEVRVKLFNLVGWTRIPKVVLGESLTEQEIARVVGLATK